MTFRFYDLSDSDEYKVHKEAYFATYDSYAGNFKAVTDLLNPVVVFKGITISKMESYNYVTMHDGVTEIGGYFITGYKVYPGEEAIEVTMKRDVLYTYRSEIDGTDAYIDRSDYELNVNGLLSDSLIPIEKNQTLTKERCYDWLHSYWYESDTYLDPLETKGHRYVIILQSFPKYNNAYVSNNPLTILVTNSDGFSKFNSQLLTSQVSGVKYLVEAIKGCYVFPFEPSNYSSMQQVDELYIEGLVGDTLTLPTTAEYRLLKHIQNKYVFTHTFTLPYTDDTTQFMNVSPFTEYYINFVPFGRLELDGEAILKNKDANNQVTFNLIVKTDFTNGESVLWYNFEPNYDVGEDDTRSILLGSGNVAMHLPVVSSTRGDLTDISSSVASLGIGLLTTPINTPLGLALFAKGATDAMTNVINTKSTPIKTCTIGSTKIIGSPSLHIYKNTRADSASSIFGKLVCKVDTLGDYLGYYVKVGEVHLANFASKTELDEIESLLKSGVHI